MNDDSRANFLILKFINYKRKEKFAKVGFDEASYKYRNNQMFLNFNHFNRAWQNEFQSFNLEKTDEFY